MILETVSVGSMQVNCYILASRASGRAMIIDPGDEKRKIERVLRKHALKAEFIVNTHGHIDHIGCDDKFGIPVYIHRADSAMLGNAELNLSSFLGEGLRFEPEIKIMEDKDNIALDGIEMEVIHTPGHTPGGICLLMRKPKDKILFSGDSLFYHGVGRTDFPGASGTSLINSIKQKLFLLSDDTVVYPGHGPSTTIGEERDNNAFL
ncbi:MAG: MBL fold metallo-hydrolase [Candidatus Omnitrophica bacterium]|nr:MBL fold metallo-hydrolase [Candidatus Omnitrophota bacterium]MDD5553937.1 MBL fold metallo-hydrolase [Candidatus Omnitrophota bacterium]